MGQKERSVVHPNNPLKRIPVSAAQAMKPTEKAIDAAAAGPGPTPMHRLAAAQASMGRKKVAQTSASVLPQPATIKAATDGRNEDSRPAVRGMVGNSAKRAVSSGSAPSAQPPAKEHLLMPRRASETNGAAAQASAETKGKAGEGPAGVQTGDERPHLPSAANAGEKQSGKRQRPADINERRGRADAERRQDGRGPAADPLARNPVRHRVQQGTQGVAGAKHGSRLASGEAEQFLSRQRERARTAAITPAKAASGAGAASRAAASKPAQRQLAAGYHSSDEDMVPLKNVPVRPRSGAAPAHSLDGQERPLQQAAATVAVGQRWPSASSAPRRPASQSPQKRLPDPNAGGRPTSATDGSHRPAKRRKRELHVPSASATVAAAPATDRRDGTARAQISGKPAAARGHLPPHEANKASASACRILPTRSALVTHDVEVQTEPPDVRDSSVQTTQQWGRSTACQADLPRADSPPQQKQRPAKSISVQCDISGATRTKAEDSAAMLEEEEEAGAKALRTATDALRAMRGLLSPRQHQQFAYHEGAILEILGVSSDAGAVAPGAAGADSQGWNSQVDDMGAPDADDPDADDNADRPMDSVGVEGGSGEWAEGGVEEHAVDESVHTDPHSERASVGATELGHGVGGDCALESPRREGQEMYDDVACSPDEVPLNGSRFREESPDEAPVAALDVDVDGEGESDDEVPLVQATPAGSAQAAQESEMGHGGAEVGTPVDGSSNSSVPSELDDDSVVQAAIMSRLRKLLPKADLNVATSKSVRTRLEFSLRRDLKLHTHFIKHAINDFLSDPAAFAVESPEEAALAAQLAPQVQHKPAAAERALGAAATPGNRGSAGHAGPRGQQPPAGAGAAVRVAGGADGADKHSSPAPDLVGRLNGSPAAVPRRKGGAALYVPANKSAKERFRTSMTPEQLRDAKAAAQAVLD